MVWKKRGGVARRKGVALHRGEDGEEMCCLVRIRTGRFRVAGSELGYLHEPAVLRNTMDNQY